jgi:hypothetical protein
MGIKGVPSFFGKLPGFFTFGDVSTGSWLTQAWFAPLGCQVGRNDKVMFKSLLSDAKLFFETGGKGMARTMGSGSLFSQKVGIPVTYPPEMVIAHVNGCLVGEMGFHPNHLKKTMACFEPGCPGKVDCMPKQSISRRAVIGAFVEARGHPKVITDGNSIACSVLERLQDSSGFCTRDRLLARGAPIRITQVVKIVPINMWQNAGQPKATSSKHRVATMLPSTAIPSKDCPLHRQPSSPGDLELEIKV